MKGGYFMERKQGFTLAEVLITLVIIGIIAAMTLPSLLGGTNKQEIKTGLQKAVSTLSQAITLHYALTGVDFTTMKDVNVSDQNLTGFINTRFNAKTSNTSSVTTQDGIEYNLSNISTTACSQSTPCQVIVDVNGKKGPNQTTGDTANSLADIKDVFTLYVYGTTVTTINPATVTNGTDATPSVASSFLDDCYTATSNTCTTTTSGGS